MMPATTEILADQPVATKQKVRRHWLPALAGLNKRDIHDPARLGGLFGIADYPRPLVDLAASRSRALAAFKALERSHE